MKNMKSLSSSWSVSAIAVFILAGGLNLYLLAQPAVAQTAVQAWVQRYNGPGNYNDRASAVAVDGSNNVIVTGYSAGINLRNDYATLMYSSAGVPLWTNRYNGSANGNDAARAVAVDSSNNVIVTGISDRTASGSSYEYATLKYSSAGAPLWTNHFGLLGATSAYALAVDSSNNVIVTGDYATIQYSSGGVPLWTNLDNGPAYPKAVVVDGSNNVIVTGYSPGIFSGNDYATVQYSSEGVPLWTNRYNGPGNGEDQAAAVAVDGSNNVIVTGWSLATSPTTSVI